MVRRVNRSDYADSKSVQLGAAPGLSVTNFYKKVSDMSDNLEKILEKGMQNQGLSDDDLAYLLLLKSETDIQKLFAAARKVREREFGDKIFLYGFVYFSTYCHNECRFCYYRSTNKKPHRYRKSVQEIVSTAVDLKDSGVHLIDLTMGEDDYYLKDDGNLVDLVKKIKEACDTPVMVSPGVVSDEMIESMAEAGADW